ncbi:ComEC/Rec2 family competence protein [Acidithiobacillus ferrooxidans]|uniref:hypothetical protein n=1 Tax=Acidithiobacillus ferrooxidans TaxID=920 RepID=UPI000A3EDA2A|nr:hypothetical protein [Acidithiobacillus ferrooxidans]MBU2816949.1 hypothetical protein [Acidithiobacillus ferrooxidans]MCR1342431.1 hypothetical protein [Acidithiobacillus ferrooxidans]QLK41619.1 hypothetical protein FE661_05105 [Acidithiobacillus ferrooxidans]QZT53563.1 hypothetical protein K7B00_05090 [Acidithiobacillus ferrooxidans]RRN85683.1 MAG: hypothetical protein EC577_04370 [Acidithiobacillus ferrooxidans]
MGTGDAELKSSEKFTKLEKHFDKLLDNVDTLIIPHHGSMRNYNQKIADYALHHIITSDHHFDPKGHHPSDEVMLSLRKKGANASIVTLADDTAVLQCCDFLCL